MKRLILFLLMASGLFAAELSIPNLSPVGWTPGTDVGVPGGIAQYRPGGASQRTTLVNVVDTYGADNTGATDAGADANTAVAATSNGQVLYFPYGLYKTTQAINLGTKRITVRGAGDGALSTSSVALGTGTKTFTVAAGLGWTAGIGTRVWHVTDRHKWMQGTVTSYSGTTLVLDITSRSTLPVASISRSGTTATCTVTGDPLMTTGDSINISGANEANFNGDYTITVTGANTFTYTVANSGATSATGTLVAAHAGTLDFWTVGQTVFVRDGSHQLFLNQGNGDQTLGVLSAITGSPTAGATTLTVADGSAFYGYPEIGLIDILPATNGEIYEHGPHLRGAHRIYVLVTNVSGNTVTLGTPLPVGLPTGRSPRLRMRPGTAGGYSVGYELFAAFGGESKFFNFAGVHSSWLYRVQTHGYYSYHVEMQAATSNEIAFCFLGGDVDGGNMSASTITTGGLTYSLFRDSVIDGGIATEGSPDFNNAYLRNVGINDGWETNHGFGNHYRLWEHNIVPFFKFDGYFGGGKYDTTFRNWLDGADPSLPFGFLIHQRYNLYTNNVGNILGKSGVSQGGHSMGNPNIGNSNNSGETATASLWVSSGGVSGVRHRHLDPSSQPRISGTIASKSGTEVTITLSGGATFEGDFALAAPAVSGGHSNWHVVWGSVSDDTLMTVRKDMAIIPGSSSGSTLVLDDDGETSGTALPAVSTTVWIWPRQNGNQELDGSVEDTAFNKHNYVYGASGASGSISDSTTDTLPNSLAESAAPADWPTGTLTWPPAIHADTPNPSRAVIPSGYFVTNGTWPTASGGGTTYTPGRLRFIRR